MHDTQAAGRRERLALQDTQLGELTIGEMSISRIELYEMGARLNGRPISAEDCTGSTLDQHAIDTLRLDPQGVRQRITHNLRLPATLFELSTLRSPDTEALMPAGPDADPSLQTLETLLDSARRLELSAPEITHDLPSWVDRLKSRSMTSVGAGMQAYGIYSGILGAADALRRGDSPEVLINLGGIAAEGASLIVEQGLEKTGRAMLQNGCEAFRGFPATSAGKWLARSAGLIASALTLPFDLHSAIKSFEEAQGATGKVAQDHYVNGALSLLSAGLSLGLGAAALAGFGSAGPVGLAAGALLILGARIYGAARQVDDIDDYIELSLHERWRCGWFAFTGQALDSRITDRYLIARTDDGVGKRQIESARQWLDSELKDSIDAVVFGKYRVELQPARYWKRYWDEAAGEQSYIETQEPVIHDQDDEIDASQGLDLVPQALHGEAADHKAVYWQLGDGNDQVTGLRHKPNFFNLGVGKKKIVGGDKDDHFQFEAADRLLETLEDADSQLRGGAGSDTLQFNGNAHGRHADNGLRIDLENGNLSLHSRPEHPVATLESIENVVTLSGARSHVRGNAQANRIVLRGRGDHAAGGEGDDQLSSRGSECTLAGGPGTDRYFIADNSGTTTIVEDGNQDSSIEMDWSLERIQSWRIEDTSLVMLVLNGADGELPDMRITIPGVYRTHGTGRVLVNDRWLFISRDGYLLKPDLAHTLPGQTHHDLKAVILQTGRPSPPPTPVRGVKCALTAEPDRSWFLHRHQPSLELDIEAAPATDLSTTLYLDYDNHEIQAAQLHYTVTSTRTGHFDYLHYRDIHLVLTLNDSTQLTLRHVARNRLSQGTSIAHSSLIAAGMELSRQILLTTRDGKSCRLALPDYSYFADHNQPGDKWHDARSSLKERKGRYLFNPPATHAPIRLGPQAQRIDVRSGPQSAVHVLEGQGGHYAVYPAADSLLRLSTPETRGGRITASTWTIHTGHLPAPVDGSDLILEASRLYMGSVIISFARHENPEMPADIIHVRVHDGHGYDIDLDFELMLLTHVNARAYADPELLLADLQRQQSLETIMADRVLIEHASLADGRPGAVYYQPRDQTLVAVTPETKILNPADVLIVRS